MNTYCVLLIGLLVGVSGSDSEFPAADQEASESVAIQSIKPLTFQTALHKEINRVSNLVNEVNPPSGKSYWLPYGDRAIVGVTYPVITPEIFKTVPVVVDKYGPPVQQSVYGPPDQQSVYGPPDQESVYGPPVQQPVYGPPKLSPLHKPDLGVVISQNYVLKENFRDYGKLQVPDTPKPSDEQLIDFAKSYATSNTVGSDHVKPGWPAEHTSFVTVGLESRAKTNTPGLGPAAQKTFEFAGDADVFTNGTIMFPSPTDPTILTTIPFMLRKSEDIHHIFDGYEADAQGLIPHEKVEIKSFLHLIHAIHEDSVEEGRQSVERFRKRAKYIKRPELDLRIDPENYEDPVKPVEAENRLTTWLHSSTVGIRSITKPLALITKVLVPVEPAVPVVEKVVPAPVHHTKVVVEQEQPPLYGHLKA